MSWPLSIPLSPTSESPSSESPTSELRSSRAELASGGPARTADAAEASGPGDSARPLDLARLVADQADDIYRYAFRLCGQAADAEDLTQETFLIACDRIDSLRDGGAARAWLRTVCRRQFLLGCRKAGRVQYQAEPPEPATEADDPAGAGQWDLQAALAELPDPFRVAVVMHYLDGASYQTIAEELGLPLGTVMSRLARARTRLRSLLGDGSDAVAFSDDDKPS